MEIKIGQIYKVSRKDYPGEVFLYEKSSGTYRLLAVAVFKHPDPKAVKAVLNALHQSFFRDFPGLLQSTPMAERLAAVNYNFSRLKVPKSDLSATLVELNGQNLNVATRGNTGAWLIRDGALEHINAAGDESSPDLFSNFAAGQISEGDSLLITSKSLFNFIGVKQITEIINNNPAQAACDKILKIIKPLVATDEGVVSFLLNLGAIKTVGRFRLPAMSFRLSKKSAVLAAALIGLALTGYILAKTISGAVGLNSARAEYAKLERADGTLNRGESALIYDNFQKAADALNQARTQLDAVKAEKLTLDGQRTWLQLEKRWAELKQKIDKKR